jgi:hypothetical protein
MVKNSAYAWRQMLFFLSLLDTETTLSFVNWARSEAEKQTSPFTRQLDPALSGLERVINGGRFDQEGTGGAPGNAQRFVGWTTGRHWLLGLGKKESSDDLSMT